MKRLLPFLAALGLLFTLPGCESVKTSVSEKIHGPTYRTRVVQGDGRAVYDAVRLSAEKLGFRFVRGGPAQGRFEALGGVTSGDDLKSSRQLELTVKISPVAQGTEVSALIMEQVEDDFNKGAGMVTETPLRDTSLYEVFFRNVEQTLAPRN